jgi:nucleoside 2-deoxyribosyltransferase
MTDTALRAIETEYRGYRFRSRTEARWAVALTAAGIEWQYEAEGFDLNGARYLPDFFLPELKTFVEVKPTREAAEQAAPLMLALIEASGCDGLFAIDSPSIERPNPFFACCRLAKGRYHVWPTTIDQCAFCDRLSFSRRRHKCICLGDMHVLEVPLRGETSRLNHALGEAQRARFERGESGNPRPYVRPAPSRTIRVYCAGAIFCDDACETLETWRSEVFGCEKWHILSADEDTTAGRFVYAGPTIIDNHGAVEENLADDCLSEVSDADFLFAWIDRSGTIGTLVEIGAAYARGKPIFIAFANEQLAEQFYFVKQLATVAVITPDVMAAWKLFERWQING